MLRTRIKYVSKQIPKVVENLLHDWDLCLMETINHLLRRNSDSAHEKRDFILNHNFRQLRKLAFGVIILQNGRRRAWICYWQCYAYNSRMTYVGFAGVATNLREQKVDAKRRILIFQVRPDLVN